MFADKLLKVIRIHSTKNKQNLQIVYSISLIKDENSKSKNDTKRSLTTFPKSLASV